MARRYDDPGLLAHSLLGMFYALSRPEHAAAAASRRKSDAGRLPRLQTLAELLYRGTLARAHTLCSRREMWWRPIRITTSWVDGRKRETGPSQSTSSPCFGPLGPRCRAASKTASAWPSKRWRSGSACKTEAASGVFGQQMFALRREQGRLKEVEPMVRMFRPAEFCRGRVASGPGGDLLELGLTDGRANGIRKPCAARLRRLASRRGVDGNHDLPRRRLHLSWRIAPAPKRCTRFSCPSPARNVVVGSGTGLLRRPLAIPGCVSYDPRALGRRGATL